MLYVLEQTVVVLIGAIVGFIACYPIICELVAEAKEEKMLAAEKKCNWYVTEDINMEYVHCNDETGFCLIKDLFTPCNGCCSEYIPYKNTQTSEP